MESNLKITEKQKSVYTCVCVCVCVCVFVYVCKTACMMKAQNSKLEEGSK